MTIKEYIETKKLKDSDWLTITFNGMVSCRSIEQWKSEKRLMAFKCKEIQKQVIEVTL